MDEELTRFDLLDTPFIIKKSGLLAPVNIFMLGFALTGGQPLWRRLRYGLFAALTYIVGDVTHFGGHIVSSKMGEAPMDEVRIQAPMPQAVYHNNDVPPQAHRMRAIGGPVGSAATALFFIIIRGITRPGSAARDFCNTMAIGNGTLGLGSLLLPLPMVDGGVLLKWTLVENGQWPAEADATVERANLAAGGLLAILGSIIAMRKNLTAGLLVLSTAAAAIAVGLGKLKM